MGKDTSIGWTDSTVNFVRGCTKVSPGCEDCYWMERIAGFMHVSPTEIFYYLLDKKRQDIKAAGLRIFVNSISDTFHEKIPFEVIDQWFDVFAEFPNKTFQVLTKRTNRMLAFVKWRLQRGKAITRNVWLGTSVENQWHTFRVRTLQLVKALLPEHVVFVSFEPLIGPITKVSLAGIDWIIVGGESGNSPREMQPGWADGLRLHAKRWGAAFFFKQMGGRGGDGAGGDRLYGQQYKEFPARP